MVVIFFFISALKKAGVINDAPKKSPGEKVHISMQMPKLYPIVPPKFKGDVMGTIVYKSDFDSLNEDMELTDAILDAFLVLMERKALERSVYVYTMPANLLAFACFDSSMLGEFDAPYFVDLWLVPTQINWNHWILFIVFVGRKHIMILDSMDRSGVLSGEKEARLKVSALVATELNHFLWYYILKKYSPTSEVVLDAFLFQMLIYLLNLSHTNSLKQPLQVKDWHVYLPRDVSIQKNSVDCGLFVCLWAYLLCDGKCLLPKAMLQTHSIQRRKWIAQILFNCAVRLNDKYVS